MKKELSSLILIGRLDDLRPIFFEVDLELWKGVWILIGTSMVNNWPHSNREIFHGGTILMPRGDISRELE